MLHYIIITNKVIKLEKNSLLTQKKTQAFVFIKLPVMPFRMWSENVLKLLVV